MLRTTLMPLFLAAVAAAVPSPAQCADSAGPATPRTSAGSESSPAAPGKAGPAISAHAAAAIEGRYLLAFCWKSQDAETKTARAAFDAAAAKCRDRADAVAVRMTDAAEADFVKRFDLSRAPAPLVLAIAPNGSVTLGQVGKVSEPELREAFLSPGAANSLAALQQGRLVLVCFRRGGAAGNASADAGVAAFKADPNYGKATTVVTVDTADAAEADFLSELEVSPNAAAPVTVLLAPPGGLVTKVAGPVKKDTLVKALQAAGTCGPNGCGPNGCCPGAVCKPGKAPPAPARK